MRQAAHGTRHAARRGFTIMELLVVLLVIFMLMGLLLGGIHLVHGSVRRTADRATVNSLKEGATHFRQQFNFYPPLVKDMGNPVGTGPFTFDNTAPVQANRPRVYSEGGTDGAFLRTKLPGGVADMRFSIYSLPYYVLGVLEAPVDGVAGPGMRTVKRDGSFEMAGKMFQPFYDVSRKANAVYQIDAPNGRIVVRDRNDVAFRIYHWLPGQPTGPNAGQVVTSADLNVPDIVGDPANDERLRNATWAIVAAGPDGLFGNEEQLPPGLPPIGHPQYMDPVAVRIKLGLPQTAMFQDVWAKASKDNIVEILP